MHLRLFLSVLNVFKEQPFSFSCLLRKIDGKLCNAWACVEISTEL